MKYIRQRKRRKGSSKEAIIRQRIETARAPIGSTPWSKLPNGKKGSSVDQWAWEKFKESNYKDYPNEQERMVAIDNGTIGRFIEARGISTIVEREIVFVGIDDKEITINIPEIKNKPEPGVEWRKEQEALKRLMDEAQEKRDHLEAIQMIVAKNLPATNDIYKKQRAEILRQREIERIFKMNEKES